MESTNHLYEGLVKASVAAERAFLVAVSADHENYPELYRCTLAAAKIIHCDVIRYLVMLEISTKEGLVPLLWMGDVVSALYEAIRLRPLILGSGMGDVYALFHRAASEHLDDEYRALCYVKIVEYVSMTVIKQKAHGEIRRRLADERSLVPDARYIEDLIQLVNAQREFRKDAEALRLTVLEVADPIVLSPKAPAFLPALRMYAQDAAEKDRERALDELAAAMTATRNQIAHSKANYSLTGKECPPGQLPEFVGLLRLLGMQAIYWFGNIPDQMRVVR